KAELTGCESYLLQLGFDFTSFGRELLHHSRKRPLKQRCRPPAAFHTLFHPMAELPHALAGQAVGVPDFLEGHATAAVEAEVLNRDSHVAVRRRWSDDATAQRNERAQLVLQSSVVLRGEFADYGVRRCCRGFACPSALVSVDRAEQVRKAMYPEVRQRKQVADRALCQFV